MDEEYENNTNTSLSKVGLWPTFTNLNENHVSDFFRKFVEIRACGHQHAPVPKKTSIVCR